jgi:hypothetical protein
MGEMWLIEEVHILLTFGTHPSKVGGAVIEDSVKELMSLELPIDSDSGHGVKLCLVTGSVCAPAVGHVTSSVNWTDKSVLGESPTTTLLVPVSGEIPTAAAVVVPHP